jgi:hypothetical protein
LQNFFTTLWFSRLFPDITKEHGINKKLDVRCGFSKSFLSGKIKDTHTSQIWFRKGNKIDYSFNFGCGVFVSKKAGTDPKALFQSIIAAAYQNAGKTDNSAEEWINYRSIFLSVNGGA